MSVRTFITPEKCKHYTMPLLHQHWTNTACRYGASTGPIHCASTGPMLNHYYPSTGPIQHAGTGPVHCASTGPMLNHYYPSTGPIQHAGTGPVHCASTGPMLDQHWPNTGAVQDASIGPIHSLCAAYALGQCRLYRPASIGRVLAQYCHVSWGPPIPMSTHAVVGSAILLIF